MFKILVLFAGFMSQILYSTSNYCQSNYCQSNYSTFDSIVDFPINFDSQFLKENKQHRIVNGVEIPSGQLRNLGRLVTKSGSTCTATLLKISDYIPLGGQKFFALTAGHCVKLGTSGPSQYERDLESK